MFSLAKILRRLGRSMRVVAPVVAGGLVTACMDTTPDLSVRQSSSIAMTASLGYGWEKPISKAAVAEVAGSKRSASSLTLAGYSLSEIVQDPKVRIRKDEKACVTCHSWAAWSDRESFCDRVDDFLSMPTAKEDGSDPPDAKPIILKKLLAEWQDEGCPN